MKKRAVTLLLCLVLVVLSLLRGFAASAAGIIPATKADFDVPCAAAILIDEDSGTVLYEKNADARRPIASITKVMTLLLAFEALEAGKIHLDDFVPVSEHAYHMGGSQIWLEPGEQFTLDEMLKAKVPGVRTRIECVGPVIGAHCGPGTVAICFLGKERAV